MLPEKPYNTLIPHSWLEVSREGRKIEDLEQRIEELDRKLNEMKARRDRLNEEAFQWAEKRNRLHEEIRKLRLEAESFREKRDALNREVQHLKVLRGEVWKKYHRKIDHLKSSRLRVREAAAKKPRRSCKSLKNEVERIDWKIQTESLSLEEEKRLIEQLKDLESQLEVYRAIRAVKDEIVELEDDVRVLKEEIKNYREKILKLAKQSQTFHERMTEKLERAKKLRAEADEMHQKYAEEREKAKIAHSRYAEILGAIKSLRKIIREKLEEERTRQTAELRKKLEREALGKLKRGEKLTFEEFKILAERGII